MVDPEVEAVNRLLPVGELHELSGTQPRGYWEGWRQYLCSLSVADQVDGVVLFTNEDHNYIVFPNGTIVCNLGLHGFATMDKIRASGALHVLRQTKTVRLCVKRALLRANQVTGKEYISSE